MEKQSIALVIHNPRNPAQILAVLRPPDDDELPNVWGLPAGSLRRGETVESAAVRVGRQKLGIGLAVDGPLALGEQDRAEYTLTMTLLQARITDGSPRLPKPPAGSNVTLYADWRWAGASVLEEGALKGSLCCQLFLQYHQANST